jgi:hypothetical protein
MKAVIFSKVAVVCLGLLLMVGCGSNPNIVDLPMQICDSNSENCKPGVAAIKTLSDGFESELTVTQIGIRDIDQNGNEVLNAVTTDQTVDDTAAAKISQSALGGSVGSGLQTYGQIKSTKIATDNNLCGSGGCGGGGTTQIGIDIDSSLKNDNYNANASSSTNTLGCTDCAPMD